MAAKPVLIWDYTCVGDRGRSGETPHPWAAGLGCLPTDVFSKTEATHAKMHTHSDINILYMQTYCRWNTTTNYFIYTHTNVPIDPVHSAGLALLWLFVGAEVCTHLLCVCVISLRQTTALKGARLQTLHWDETPATGLRPEPWRTNTHRWRGHSYHGQSRHSITAQEVWHSGAFVPFKTILLFRFV